MSEVNEGSELTIWALAGSALHRYLSTKQTALVH